MDWTRWFICLSGGMLLATFPSFTMFSRRFPLGLVELTNSWGSRGSSCRIVVCGSGPGRTRPHNRHCVRHRGTEKPQLGWTAAVESNSSVRFKCLLHSCLKQGSSRQMQGVMVAALNRWRELRVQCAASALCSSTEAASSVLSTLSNSWIACMGRANSSTRHPPAFQNLLAIGKQIYGRQGSETMYRNQKQSEKHKGPVNLTLQTDFVMTSHLQIVFPMAISWFSGIFTKFHTTFRIHNN